MGIEEYKITGFKKPVSALADTPQMGADELKAWFDSNSTDELKTSVNGIIDSVVADEAALAGKVDKEAGKGLSTNDYTDAEKAKNHTHTNASVLDASTAAYTTAEKTKLSGIAAGANNYVHPASHSADMISTTASKRFTSDAEMEQKADKSYVDSGLSDKADGASVYAALDTKADKTAVDAIAPKAHTHANADILDDVTATSLIRTQNIDIDGSGADVTDLDSLPNGLTQVPYCDGPGAGGYLVFTSLDPSANMGYQIKLSKDATLWRWRNYDGWGAWNPQTGNY